MPALGRGVTFRLDGLLSALGLWGFYYWGRFHRTLPAIDSDLAGTSDRQLRRRYFLDDRGAGRDGGSRAHRDRGDQHTVGSRVHVILNDRAVFIHAVVIGD